MNFTKININLIGHDSIVSIELPYLLSEIEVSLLCQLLQGYSVNEISQKRNRSIKTVSCQKIKLYKKLGVKSDLTLWRDVFFMFKVSIQAKNITCNKLNNSFLPETLSEGEFMLRYNIYYQPIYNAEYGNISGCDVTIALKNTDSTASAVESEQINYKPNDNKISYLFRHINKLFSPIQRHLPHGFFIIININPEDILTCDIERECLNFIKIFGQERIKLVLQFSTKEELYIIRRFQSSLRRIRNNNVYLSLNDFGMGYAELSHLQNIPFSYVSLNRAMFHDIGCNSLTDIIATTIIDLSKQLNIDVIADGIETKKQAGYMIERGIKYLKGIALSSPLPEDAFVRKLLTSLNQV
ncbi:TPA: EAL domain-containing protein [Escherichia coli]|nr:EAL domain-containing protein [Escherichia coli]HBA4706279.1 EAL domain-containing protein [Escherichia coli]HBA5157624.1 EAL domain-containing protein [Escherichia coli]HDP7614095.1 EAL domain-containing protein [Escherichia coli]